MGSSTQAVAGQHTRRRNLDGIRALAILAVFFSHSYLKATYGGWIGVEVFFVLSGYLITTVLMNEWRKRDGIALGRFYARRALRLYPALLVLLILGVVAYAHLGYQQSLAGYGRSVLAAGLYFQDFIWAIDNSARGGFGHTWSLAVEEQFYIVWPLLLILGLRHRRFLLPATIGVALLSLLVVAVAFRSGSAPTYYLPTSQAPLLLAGAALAIARENGALNPRIAGSKLAAIGIGGLAITGLVSSAVSRDRLITLQLLACAVFAVVLILGLDLDGESRVSRFLGWRPLAALGLISYSFYLYYLVSFELEDAYLHWGLIPRAVVCLAFTLAAAAASYLLVERYFLGVKARLSVRVEAIATTDLSAADVDRAAPHLAERASERAPQAG